MEYFYRVNQVPGFWSRATRHYFGHDAGSVLIHSPYNHYTRRPTGSSICISLVPVNHAYILGLLLRALAPNLSPPADASTRPYSRAALRYSRFVATAAAVCAMQLHSLLPSKRNVRWTHRPSNERRQNANSRRQLSIDLNSKRNIYIQ